MKSGILLLIFSLLYTSGFAQKKTGVTDSCISDMQTITRKPIGKDKIHVIKKTVPNIIASLKACSPDYRYPSEYEDHSFQITIPSFLGKMSYGQGDFNFYYSFNDSNNADSLTAALTIQYDFGNNYRNFFYKEVAREPKTNKVSQIGDITLYQFTNAEGFLCGQIFLENNMYLFYYTSNKLFEEKLKEALFTFKWNQDLKSL